MGDERARPAQAAEHHLTAQEGCGFAGRAARLRAVSDDEPTTQELKTAQAERSHEEAQRAAGADQPDEARAHERRAEKAAYLRDRLAEAERSEAEDG